MLKFAEDGDIANKAPKKKQYKPNNKKNKHVTAEEEDLASELFGDIHSRVLAPAKGDAKERSDNTGAAAMWEIDTQGVDAGSSSHRKRPCVEGAAAWVDEDDEDLGKVSLVNTNRLRKLRTSQAKEDIEVSGKEYEEKLRARFQASQSEHMSSWAKLPDKEEEAEEEEGEDFDKVLRSTAPMKSGGPKKVPQGELNILRCKDANAVENSRAAVRVVSFHPKGEILMTAGLDKTVKCVFNVFLSSSLLFSFFSHQITRPSLSTCININQVRFFNIDGKKNAKIDGVFFKDMPIYCAEW
jgi:WD40 repeat protein